jgi:hypothetical protein
VTDTVVMPVDAEPAAVRRAAARLLGRPGAVRIEPDGLGGCFVALTTTGPRAVAVHLLRALRENAEAERDSVVAPVGSPAAWPSRPSGSSSWSALPIGA